MKTTSLRVALSATVFNLICAFVVSLVPSPRIWQRNGLRSSLKRSGTSSNRNGAIEILWMSAAGMPAEEEPTLSASVADLLATARAMKAKPPDEISNMPEVRPNGVHCIVNENQYRNFLEANSDKIVVVSFSAAWCRACKDLARKMSRVYTGDELAGSGVVFGEFSATTQNNDYILSLDVSSLPSMHFYAMGGGEPVENFACGPNHVSFSELKKKIFEFAREDRKANDSYPAKPTISTRIICWIRLGLSKLVRRKNSS